MSRLHVVMYHYVQDPASAKFPRLKGMRQDDFVRQVDDLRNRFQMVSLPQAMEFWSGAWAADRDCCLLTFDDGLKEHAEFVTPVLAERGIAGLFFVISSCADGKWMASVHQNHALMAELAFRDYAENLKAAWLDQTGRAWPEPHSLDMVAQAYRWDDLETARFKYSLNFLLPAEQKEKVLDQVFAEVFGSSDALAREWYASVDELKAMQEAGQVIGGHTDRHQSMVSLHDRELREDLRRNRDFLHQRLNHQELWPFCYPYGKRSVIPGAASALLKEFGFCCGFSTEVGVSEPGEDLFCIRRLDCKDV